MKIYEMQATKSFIDDFYSTKEAPNLYEFNSGTLILIKDPDSNASATGISYKNKIILCNTFKDKTLNGFSPKDLNQTFYFNLLSDENYLLIAALGAAGTGKTSIAIAKALHNYFNDGQKIYLCKPTVMVQSHENNVFGPVPGDINEKYAPYLGSFEIVLNKVLGDNAKHYLEMMFKKKHIEFMPVEFTRGCTFEDCTFILDEVQNLSWHELKTVLSRIGENSNIILCGDPDQIDAQFSYQDSGLYKLLNSNSFKKSNFTASVLFTKQYRGKIPDLIYHIDKE
jgi:predicted ribonuclease YlaK